MTAGLALAAALLHPNAFGAMWIVLVMLCLWHIITKQNARDLTASVVVWRVWLIAFGPLLALSLLSIPIHGSGIGRIEPLEPVLGGLILAAGLSAYKSDSQWLFRGALLGSVFALGVTVVEMGVFHEPRAGMQYHPINFGMACGAVLLLLMIQLKKDLRPITLLGALACGLALMGSGSRGPILAFFICAACLPFVANRHENLSRTSRKTMVAILGLLGLFGIGILAQRFWVDVQLGESSSVGIRWHLIELSIGQILNTPWFGIGADQGGRFFSQFPLPMKINHAHVTLLNLALELGVLAALSWVWAFGVLGWFFWKLCDGQAKLAAMGGLLMTLYIFLCSMTQDLLSHTFNRRFLSFILVFLMVIAMSYRGRAEASTPDAAPKGGAI